MSDTVLLVGHGSRNNEGNIEIEKFSRQWQRNNPSWRIETCFIEFADILLDEGLHMAAQDASRVIVVPLILNAAGHVKMEIPAHIAQARRHFPDVEFIYARHFGATQAILTILKRRLHQAMLEMDMPDPKSTGVIILGRGSSDRVANGELAKMVRWLYEETEHELVDIAFTGITHPRLESVIQRQAKLGMTQLVVLPYYLFTGTLMERIHRQILHVQKQYPHIRFAAGEYFGFEKEIGSLLTQRVCEALDDTNPHGMMECDGCHFRALAEQQGHGHHHHDHHDHHEEPAEVTA